MKIIGLYLTYIMASFSSVLMKIPLIDLEGRERKRLLTEAIEAGMVRRILKLKNEFCYRIDCASDSVKRAEKR